MTQDGKFGLNPDIIRRKIPPNGGWIYRQPETSWRTTAPLVDGYDATITKIMRHRAANSHLALDASRSAVENDLIQYTAKRLLSDAPSAAREWLIPLDEIAAQKKTGQDSQDQSSPQVDAPLAGGIVERFRRDARGLATLVSWLGSGGHPVHKDVAAQRASVCAGCPKNQPGYMLEAMVAKAIKAQQSIRLQLNLSTPDDAKLKTCHVCQCHLPLKVWVPLDKIKRDTDWEKMPDWCWIRTETERKPLMKVRRHGAYGDVIVATVIAERIKEKGFDVDLICDAVPGSSVIGHSRIGISHSGNHDIDLDATYELSPDIAERSIYDLMFDAADRQLKRRGITPLGRHNCLPSLSVTDGEKADMASKMTGPSPRIVVVPRSHAWVNRTIIEPIWRNVAHGLAADNRAMYWTGSDRAFQPLIDLRPGSFREVMAAIERSDFVVSVDTGPMHAAAGLRKPILAIKQAFKIDLRLTDHTDWQEVGAQLDCLGCCKYNCPIDAKNPPCAQIHPDVIVEAVRRRLRMFDPASTSAVIPVYKPDINRLTRVVDSIQHQVDEIVIALDGPSKIAFSHPKVRIIDNPGGSRRGYGKTVMRGARHTNGAWLLLLNDDCYLDPGSVATMLQEASPTVAVVGCLLRYPNGKIQHGGIVMSSQGVGWGHIDHNRDVPTIKAPVDMPGVTFAAALVRRSAFYAVGGFDDRFDCYCEDEDLCRTFRQNGWGIRYTPLATGVHDEGRSSENGMKHSMLVASHKILASKWQ